MSEIQINNIPKLQGNIANLQKNYWLSSSNKDILCNKFEIIHLLSVSWLLGETYYSGLIFYLCTKIWSYDDH